MLYGLEVEFRTIELKKMSLIAMSSLPNITSTNVNNIFE